jgi:uncharacterized protein YtpQ (UPF0354 family)
MKILLKLFGESQSSDSEEACKAEMPLSHQEFAALFTHLILRVASGFKIKNVDELRLDIEGPNGDVTPVYLYNAYKKYLSDPDELNEVLARYLKIFLEELQSSDATVDLSRIVPVVKDRGFVKEAIEARREFRSNEDDDPGPAMEDYNDELVVIYAEDRDNTISHMMEAVLEKCGFTGPDRLERALENLRALLPDLNIWQGEGYFQISAGGDYDSSLILLDEVWQDERLRVDGEHVIAMPARNALLVTGSENKTGMRNLREAVTDIVNSDPYVLTDQLFIRNNGKFTAFEVLE